MMLINVKAPVMTMIMKVVNNKDKINSKNKKTLLDKDDDRW